MVQNVFFYWLVWHAHKYYVHRTIWLKWKTDWTFMSPTLVEGLTVWPCSPYCDMTCNLPDRRAAPTLQVYIRGLDLVLVRNNDRRHFAYPQNCSWKFGIKFFFPFSTSVTFKSHSFQNRTISLYVQCTQLWEVSATKWPIKNGPFLMGHSVADTSQSWVHWTYRLTVLFWNECDSNVTEVENGKKKFYAM